MTKAQKASRDESVEWLRARLHPGSKIYGVVQTVSRSGMSRTIDLYAPDGDGDMLYLTGHAAAVLGYRRNDQGAMKVGGCGMDMVFNCVYNLSRALWPDGFECAGKDRCRSNDHSNGDRDYTPHQHSDGGYALISAGRL